MTPQITMENFVLPFLEKNPGILAMYRDRNKVPYRCPPAWAGEFVGKFLTGASMLATQVGGEEIFDHLRTQWFPQLETLQDSDGYFSPWPDSVRYNANVPAYISRDLTVWDLWGQAHMIIGLLRYTEVTGDGWGLKIARKIADHIVSEFFNDAIIPTVKPQDTGGAFAIMYAMAKINQKIPKAVYALFCYQLRTELAATDGPNVFNLGTANTPYYQGPKPRWETMYACMSLAVMGNVSASANLFWSLIRYDGHNNGSVTTNEAAGGDPFAQGVCEASGVYAYLHWAWELFQATDDPIYLDVIEWIQLNSALGAVHPSGHTSAYDVRQSGAFQLSGQPISSSRVTNMARNDYPVGLFGIGFQTRPGMPDVNDSNVWHPIAYGFRGMWAYTTNGTVLSINDFIDDVGVIKGSAFDGWTMSKTGGYPWTGQGVLMELTETFGGTVNGTIRIRIPHWVGPNANILLNGVTIGAITPGTYAVLTRTWADGDVLEFDFDLRLRGWKGAGAVTGQVSYYVGPLLLAYDAVDNSAAWNTLSLNLSGTMTLINVYADDEEYVNTYAPRSLWTISDGTKSFTLRDFSSVGFDGSYYESWHLATNVPNNPSWNTNNPMRTSFLN